MCVSKKIKRIVLILTSLLILFLILMILLRTSDAYVKLSLGQRVNIVIVGDSIGLGAGASDENHRWANLLADSLRNDYKGKINLDNYSLGGNTSYAGYVSVKKFNQNSRKYDLAILCYGQNDKEEDFGLYYESIIRALYQHNPQIQIISILESPQKNDSKKMREINKVCNYYGIPVVDTISPFQEYGYDLLTEDGIHPNDKGHEIYFNEVKSCITACIKHKIKNKRIQEPVYPEALLYRYMDSQKDVSDIAHSGVLGISFYLNENQIINVYKEDKLIYTKEYAGFPQSYYEVIDENYIDGQQNLYKINIEGTECLQEWFISYEK